jgi:hypothetical protein
MTITKEDLEWVEKLAKEMGIETPGVTSVLTGEKSLQELVDEGKYDEFDPSPPAGDPNLGRSDKYGPIDPSGATAQTDWKPEDAAIGKSKPKKASAVELLGDLGDAELEEPSPALAKPKAKPKGKEPKTTVKVQGGNISITTINAGKGSGDKAGKAMMDVWLKGQKAKGKDNAATRMTEAIINGDLDEDDEDDLHAKTGGVIGIPEEMRVDRDKGKTFPRADLEKRTVVDLKRLLQGEGLKKSGRKAELVERLLDHYANSEAEAEVFKMEPCPKCSRSDFGDRYERLIHDNECQPKWDCEAPTCDGKDAIPTKPAEEDAEGKCLHPKDQRTYELDDIYFCHRCNTRQMESS